MAPKGGRGMFRSEFLPRFRSASDHRGMDLYLGLVQGRLGPPPAPIQSCHRQHDGGTGRSVPARPIAGPSNPRGSTSFPCQEIHPRRQGDSLGGAQTFPELIGRPIGNVVRTPPLVVERGNVVRRTWRRQLE